MSGGVVADTLVFCARGLLPAQEVSSTGPADTDGETVQISTERGLILEGAPDHCLRLCDGSSRRLDALQRGDTVAVGGGGGSWPEQELELAWEPPGDSPRIPQRLDPDLGSFLGYLLGFAQLEDGVSLTWTTVEEALLQRFTRLCERLFEVSPEVTHDAGRWRAVVASGPLATFLVEALGLPAGGVVRGRSIPAAVLRSPEPVVRAFLRAYFDCDAWANRNGAILSTASEAISRQVQLLLLNYGILSRRGMQTDGSWHLHINGPSAARFADAVGFGLTHKADVLLRYVRDHEPFKPERWEDEVASVDRGRADVYAICGVGGDPCAAAGFLHEGGEPRA